MIYVEPGNRRADTMSIVSEGLAFRHYVTGEFKLVGKACGYLELVLKNLAEFFEAGVIEPGPRPEDRGDGIDWDGLRWTKTGHYLMQQWKQGPPRRVVEVPAPLKRPARAFPKFAAAMLLDAGWTINDVWYGNPVDHFVVSISRDGDTDAGEPLVVGRVLVLTAGGRTMLNLSDTEAKAMMTRLLAASL